VVPEDLQAQGLRELKALDEALSRTPQDAGLLGRRGQTYHRLGRYEEAVRDFSAALGGRRDPAYLLPRARSYQALKKYAEAAADLRAALEGKLSPDLEAYVSNYLAWLYVTGPEGVRAPGEALKLAARAIRLAPGRATYANTLGLAYYRLGRWDEAVEALRRSLKEPEYAAHDLFFLAMSYQRLGDTAKARDCYDQAVYWCETHREGFDNAMREELEGFRAEADALGLSSGD
jgi:tetratricopeptide (TPR) repeat protein